MDLLLAFLVAVLVSFTGSIPVGMLNLTAIYVGIRYTKRDVILYGIGVAMIEFVYVLIALFAAKWIQRFDWIETIVQVAVIPVLLILAFSYFRQDDAQFNMEEKAFGRPFLKGMFLSFINPLPIPFWLFLGSIIFSLGWFPMDTPTSLSFAVGVKFGTFLAMLFFGFGANMLSRRLERLNKVIHKLIGSIFLLLALLQTIRQLVST